MRRNIFTLISVGRLSREKLVADLIRMLPHIKLPVMLKLIGDGPEKCVLDGLARKLGVRERIWFVGSVKNERLPEHLLAADVFVSPMTGTALREAALCGLPVVAYEADWIVGLLKHEETALLAPLGDYRELAKQVMRLMTDAELAKRLSMNVEKLAWQSWSPDALKESLHLMFTCAA